MAKCGPLYTCQPAGTLSGWSKGEAVAVGVGSGVAVEADAAVASGVTVGVGRRVVVEAAHPARSSAQRSNGAAIWRRARCGREAMGGQDMLFSSMLSSVMGAIITADDRTQRTMGGVAQPSDGVVSRV